MATKDPGRPPVRIGGWIPPYTAASPYVVPPGPTPPDPGDTAVLVAAPHVRLNRGERVTWALVVAGLATVLALVAVIVADRSKGDEHTPAANAAPPPVQVPDEQVQIPIPVLRSAPSGSPSASRSATRSVPAAAGAGHPPRSPASARPAHPAVPTLTPGHRVSLQPAGRPDFRVRHRDFRARVDRIGAASPALDRADATFTVRAGLAGGGCMSFEATNYPGRYLRHQNFALFLHVRDAGAGFAADATFCPVAVGAGTVLRSRTFPDRYVVRRGSALILDRVPAGRAMTVVVRPPL